MVAATYPAGTKATAYYSSYVYNFEAGNPWHLPNSPGTLADTWHRYDPSRVRSMMMNMLRQGHYIVAGVLQNPNPDYRLDPSGVGHWVEVYKIENGRVYINNPFGNGQDDYTWDEFYESFAFWILEITPWQIDPDAPTPE